MGHHIQLKDIQIRAATKLDASIIIELMHELIKYHNGKTTPTFSVQEFINDGLEPEGNWYKCLVAEDMSTTPHQVIGYLMYNRLYTLHGRTANLEHLYVRPEYRQHHIGTLLMKRFAQDILTWNCVRLHVEVTAWNRAKNFYERLGCVNFTEQAQIHIFNICSKEKLENIANLEIDGEKLF